MVKRDTNVGYATSASSIHLPSGVGSSRISEVQLRVLVRIKASNHTGNTERTNTASLCVTLLGLGDETRHVFNGRGIFTGEAIALGFDARLHE